ncbi:MAG: polysaccharide biosynthesis protein GtrA [Spirochaetes bacterium GWF1_51_8]|nr:MAG: polysaccharide biosynthesis protein GtrA [Spirochaetes bacterium GWF1_51_8]
MKISTGIKYAVFAGIALLINLGTQAVTLAVYSGDFSIYIAMVCGTGAGLLVKYVLDKLFIFKYRTENLKEDVKKFTVYSLMGIVTTAIFWGSELLFDTLIKTEWAKFAGGAVGLTIGYTIKYFLDRKFVFTAKENKE